MAWSELSKWFQSNPDWRSRYATTPSEGENMNIHSTPATGWATA